MGYITPQHLLETLANTIQTPSDYSSQKSNIPTLSSGFHVWIRGRYQSRIRRALAQRARSSTSMPLIQLPSPNYTITYHTILPFSNYPLSQLPYNPLHFPYPFPFCPCSPFALPSPFSNYPLPITLLPINPGSLYTAYCILYTWYIPLYPVYCTLYTVYFICCNFVYFF